MNMYDTSDISSALLIFYNVFVDYRSRINKTNCKLHCQQFVIIDSALADLSLPYQQQITIIRSEIYMVA